MLLNEHYAQYLCKRESTKWNICKCWIRLNMGVWSKGFTMQTENNSNEFNEIYLCVVKEFNAADVIIDIQRIQRRFGCFIHYGVTTLRQANIHTHAREWMCPVGLHVFNARERKRRGVIAFYLTK